MTAQNKSASNTSSVTAIPGIRTPFQMSHIAAGNSHGEFVAVMWCRQRDMDRLNKAKLGG